MNLSKHRQIYHSFEMYSKDGEFLAYSDKKKIRSYLKKGLAYWVDDDLNILDDVNLYLPNEKGIIQTDVEYNGKPLKAIKLKFEASDSVKLNFDPYYKQVMVNICVCCGTNEYLTKHHVIPYMFRRYFPDEFKNNSHHDVLPVCYTCHDNYERTADKYKEEIAKRVGLSLDTEKNKNQTERDNDEIFSAQSLLQREFFNRDEDKIRNNDVISPERLFEIIKIALKKPIVLNQHVKVGRDRFRMPNNSVGEKAVKKILNKKNGKLKEENLYDFIFSWRKHFIEHAEPKYLPKHWNIYKRYFDVKLDN